MANFKRPVSVIPPRVVIKVTARHIAEGKRRDSRDCPIALALSDARPWATYCTADLATCRATNLEEGFRFVWLTPESGKRFLLRYDAGKRVGPFSMELSEGLTRPSGWKGQRSPDSTRRAEKYNKTGVKVYRPPMRREFGLQMYSR